MYKYLVCVNGKKRIFYHKPYEGICETREKAGGWTEEKNIFQNSSPEFFLYADKRGTVHLITVSKDNQLVYLINKGEEWKSFQIGKINDGIKIKKIMIGLSKIGESLFYSAEYNGEYILVHCVLGNKAMPSTIATLYDEHFFIYEDRVYYRNTDNIIMYQDFSDGKPEGSYKICEGEMPYLTSINGKNYLIYKRGSNIYVNNKPYINDKNASNPVLIESQDEKLLMWQKGDFVKYTVYDEDKKTAVHQIASGKKPDVYILSDGRRNRTYFGGFFSNTLKLYPDIDPFLQDKNNLIKTNEQHYKKEIERINELLAEQKNDIKHYQNEIKKLNDIILKMSQNTDNNNKAE